jgi:hypothetical protein
MRAAQHMATWSAGSTPLRAVHRSAQCSLQSRGEGQIERACQFSFCSQLCVSRRSSPARFAAESPVVRHAPGQLFGSWPVQSRASELARWRVPNRWAAWLAKGSTAGKSTLAGGDEVAAASQGGEMAKLENSTWLIRERALREPKQRPVCCEPRRQPSSNTMRINHIW